MIIQTRKVIQEIINPEQEVTVILQGYQVLQIQMNLTANLQAVKDPEVLIQEGIPEVEIQAMVQVLREAEDRAEVTNLVNLFL